MKYVLRLCLISFSALLFACDGSPTNAQQVIAPKTEKSDPNIRPKVSAKSTSTATQAWSHYLANEGVMVESGETKVLFDPFFVTGFGTYTELPIETKAALMKGTPPFDGIDAVFVSHAHGDHFSAPDMIAFLNLHKAVRLVAPQQAIDMIREDPDWSETLVPRLSGIRLDYGDAPIEINMGPILASAVRIAHAGWPAPHRARVENIVFRVTLAPDVTVMHMGDADPNPVHYEAYAQHWQSQNTQTAFPPYWMLTSEIGRTILEDMAIKNRIGVHVPINIPQDLRMSGEDYFSNTGEMREIK